jgi:Domain of unknown function (DUF4760)
MTLADFSRDYAPLIAVGGVLVSVLAAGIFVRLQIHANRRISRERATLDLLLKREWDADYLKHKAIFNTLRDAEGGLAKWICEEHKNTDQANTIRYIFNDYELICLAIKRSIIDEDVYKDWFKGSMLRDFRSSKSAIYDIRSLINSNDLYIQWENLATKWIGASNP